MTHARENCEVCGQKVEPNSRPVETSGWYGGHEYAWRDGLVQMVRSRCDGHPHSDSEDAAVYDAYRDAEDAREAASFTRAGCGYD